MGKCVQYPLGHGGNYIKKVAYPLQEVAVSASLCWQFAIFFGQLIGSVGCFCLLKRSATLTVVTYYKRHSAFQMACLQIEPVSLAFEYHEAEFTCPPGHGAYWS